MVELQRTISKPVSLSGIGLHTGTECTMTFKPAPINSGIKFIRVDLGGNPEIPAIADNVVDISRGTTIGIGEAKVHTVEHVLAAIAGLQIDNINVELDGMEPPIGDGSAISYVNALLEAGIEQQDAPKDYLIIDETVMYSDAARQVDIVALPLDKYRLTVMVDYQNPALGSQHTGLFDLEKEFVTEFASARTFCFLSEVEDLANQGLIKGGDLDNAVVIVDRQLNQKQLDDLGARIGISEKFVLGEKGILNNKQLRYKNEPVRHKLLDLIGDLALIGVPIKAQILAARPGHKANVEFAKQIRKLYQQKKLVKKFQFVKKEGVVFDVNAISRILPHRYPFLLVDKIVHLEVEKKVIGVKSVTVNEPFFQGHFPGQPVMPGVLIIEAMAQTGGILLLNSLPDFEEKLVYFMQINNAKFRKPVVPGDQLFLEVEMLQKKSKIFTMAGKVYVDDILVAEADFMAGIVDRPRKAED
ncbi:MAG TPA: bifunctional UDP-3-O-[3-hydroxymyristoyl] N-acetylglucosamine deacetylase/3-hydroxyacyl-ACP dehydratase [Ignavibacteriaceae bacterium]|jgi:UDP-3-O-[3-hydroxymyristoyl] N-acetylglucosamine deacetylase/3-hydroxyacyl-[acyl-carrier-protein] dehydratase|nr:MAG: UDP-3-O-(3-hydroxymyristoyl) N-acetylglucosamine deacetylase [Ignavibacteria bacterium ADurb.Bin266]OQY73340.1 MAG: UDP-3-O-[3-hydroxymyristoyl] N-acetylglucosamine deacetylase [Ignavibacteriales bacterium UTCHB2]HQF41922.1 bifunctional UDP-3-O-[3-hydroxymyristoyl] N-acetylglucosamine deacetylase/3-hydroxyacyl-ACP dehydratase [Ignavibacteriaceae bacterium]HQI41177.1 bifunctional UDP-3-O-[3-hydroxymyristoyl] N-acetylglucosamine deacetylase/3-hydroxyacyl-ACP dehydratase [Ignavibacteriaceae